MPYILKSGLLISFQTMCVVMMFFLSSLIFFHYLNAKYAYCLNYKCLTRLKTCDKDTWFLAISGSFPSCWCSCVGYEWSSHSQASTSHTELRMCAELCFFFLSFLFLTLPSTAFLPLTLLPPLPPWAMRAEMEGEMDDVILNCDMFPCKSVHYNS